jgi:hypothetical protein
MILLTVLGRGLVAWQMALHLDGLLLFPLAFGLLVLQKGYSVAKSAVVPSLVRNDIELVEAIEEELAERSVGFRIEDEVLEDLKTVRDAVDYVSSLLG